MTKTPDEKLRSLHTDGYFRDETIEDVLDEKITEAAEKIPMMAWNEWSKLSHAGVAENAFISGANFMRTELQRELKIAAWFDKNAYDLKRALEYCDVNMYGDSSAVMMKEWPEPNSFARSPEEKE